MNGEPAAGVPPATNNVNTNRKMIPDRCLSVRANVRPVIAGVGLALAAAIATRGSGAAQAPSNPTASAETAAAPAAQRPEYRVLRFDENWGAFGAVTPAATLDGLKYVPLSSSGAAYLSVGGQFRARTERVTNFLASPGPGGTDGFGLTRTLLHADAHAGPHLRAFVEGKHAVAIGRELPGGRRPLDHDEWEVQNAFVDLACCAGDTPFAATLRVGRQELLLGSQRLVSPLDWSNARRTFEGMRLTGRAAALAFDGFVTRPVAVRVDEPNRRDPRSTFWGGAVRPVAPGGGLGWEVYLLGLTQDSTTSLWGREGEHDRYTLGARATGAVEAAGVRYDVEGGWQTGRLGTDDISAWFVAADLTRAFAGIPASPAVTVGLDYSSGDGDPGDGVLGTFHQLYPLGHAYAGFMDVLGRQNLVEARVVIVANPVSGAQLRGSVHHFLRASDEDAAYNVGGGILRVSPGAERTIGTELDLTSTYRLTRHVRLEGGLGYFRAGGFLVESSAGAANSTWLYASTAFTF